ncbi:MAG TPA: hypothetical protein VK449_05875, partial [Anaerolineales bacterium]|nr:hypothetical protein [Anaerolineales bacterium]
MADPLAPVLNVLRRRQELLGWTVTHRRLRGEQLFSDRTKVEARRTVEKAEIAIQVLCAAKGDPD